jgi:hypothetical protein
MSLRSRSSFPRVRLGDTGVNTLSPMAVCLCAVMMIFASSCNRLTPSSRLLHESKAVDRQGADSVHVRIHLPAGRLTLSGGSNKLMEADFHYMESEGIPRVSYSVTGESGDLELSQPGRQVHVVNTAGSSGERNEWSLRFNGSVPEDLTVEMGAGQGDLRVGELSLTRFNLDMGAGEAKVDFRGNWKKSMDAEIHGGVGTMIVTLPANIGVRVHTEHGIGTVEAPSLQKDGDDYVNASYRQSPVTLTITVKTGVGAIKLVSAS